ncbi:MAG: ATP-binding protein [Candidatus Delongbacteria bacterium]|nr:ATP-binding protein [Candidatus Delongbacteria bacterium]
MPANLGGRLRNTPLPLTSGLLPLFEAVVNSIHALEEASVSTEDGRIRVTILRGSKQGSLNLRDSKKRGPDALEDIVGFKIEDNGIGFTDDNMLSFRTLDSEHKIQKGCRGIGRLLWLKAFKNVRVESTYRVGESLFQRTFTFSADGGVSNEENYTAPVSSSISTSVHLDEFNTRYREYARKTPGAIADSIFEHCLWYFIRQGGAPLIELVDEAELISINDVYDAHMHSSAVPETISIKEQSFDLVHVRLRYTSLSAHFIAFCADNRLVAEEKLSGKLPGLHGKLTDANGEFVYSCYVSSAFLDENVRPERTGFEIIDNVDGLFANTEIGLNDIREAVVERAKVQLAEHLEKNLQRSKDKVSTFVATKAPRYRPILSRIPETELNIDPDISDKDLELTLHKQFANFERELISEGHDILSQTHAPLDEQYRTKLESYLAKAADIKKSDLASYVSHRRVIIDLFEKAIEKDVHGNYVREELIHSLIIQMRKDSSELLMDSCNLWLVDERLAFHDYLASDKPLKSIPITASGDGKEPDICVLNVFDQPILVSEGTKLPPASIEIVEIKRPMRNDAKAGQDHDPIEQAIDYLERIRQGGVMTSTGRPIPSLQNNVVPGFCYILADLTPSFEKRCRIHHNLKRTSDGQGYFGYKDNVNAYVEVISFGRLVNMAKERNRAFFDKLGLPAN